jgi:hypothetical protein
LEFTFTCGYLAAINNIFIKKRREIRLIDPLATLPQGKVPIPAL